VIHAVVRFVQKEAMAVRARLQLSLSPRFSISLSLLGAASALCASWDGQGTTFWGHMIIDNACLREALTNGHPDMAGLGLGAFSASVVAEVLALGGAAEGFNLRLRHSWFGTGTEMSHSLLFQTSRCKRCWKPSRKCWCRNF